ncbi:hypothetical protein IFM89_013507 [Coptis chinensis]|uniref:SHSP domain-containing protein n=1 Tax=Coptis chinensis TaxID=261450 RepID=A0A835H441_9MAGN|nr:hypothetical protein IFM89_013507 [Coptis chinensis]
MATWSLPNNLMRSYEDFQPSSNWVGEEDVDTFVIHLPGFRKEHLRIQIDTNGNLKISGECPIEGNRWSRFRKEFSAPQNCNTNEITAKFAGGLLYVKFPNKISDVIEQDERERKQVAPADENTMNEKKKSDQVSGSLTTGPGKVNGPICTQSLVQSYKPTFGGLGSSLRKHKVLVAGIVITAAVVVVLGVYGLHKLRSPAGEDLN